MRLSRSFLASFLLLYLGLFVADGQRVPALFIFGDSFFDVGNNNNLATLIKANFLPYERDFVTKQSTGRFCNGKLAADFTGSSFSNSPILLPLLFIYLFIKIPFYNLGIRANSLLLHGLDKIVKLELSLTSMVLRKFLHSKVVKS
jgi:hypothetical protein